MKAVVSMAMKDLRLLLMDKGGLFFIFFFPLMYAIFFGYISAAMSGGGGGDGPVASIRVAIVDEDGTEASQEFVALLEDAEELNIERFDSRDAAKAVVQEGKRAAMIVVPAGFGERGQSFFIGDPPTVQVAADPSRTAEKGMLQGILMKYGAQRMQSSFTDTKAMRDNAAQAMQTLNDDADTPPMVRLALQGFLGSLSQLADQLDEANVTEEDIQNSDAGAGFEPLKVESIPLLESNDGDGPEMSPFAISFPQGIIWGIMGAAAGFGISLVTERTHGTMIRLRLAPVTQGQILGGKALACFVTTIAVAVTLLVIGRLAFGVTPQSPLLLAVAIVCVAACFVGVMMLLSVIGRTEASASGIGWAALVVMAMVGGGMIPLMFIEKIPFLAMLSSVSPVKWSILAIEGAVWRGFTPGQMLLPCVVLLGVGAGAFALGATIFCRTERA